MKILHDGHTELRKYLCTRFGEVCSCCCLSLLPRLACIILATMYKEIFSALYVRSAFLTSWIFLPLPGCPGYKYLSCLRRALTFVLKRPAPPRSRDTGTVCSAYFIHFIVQINPTSSGLKPEPFGSSGKQEPWFKAALTFSGFITAFQFMATNTNKFDLKIFDNVKLGQMS